MVFVPGPPALSFDLGESAALIRELILGDNSPYHQQSRGFRVNRRFNTANLSF
jgi:hypothetical protein